MLVPEESVMDESKDNIDISDEDLRAALREIKGYVDITEEDLRKIYRIALRHVHDRLAGATPVRDVMTRDVVTVGIDADIHEAARLLSERRISGMPVIDESGRVIGVISEADILSSTGMKKGYTFRDVLRHLLGEPLPSRKDGEKAREIMSVPAVTIGPDQDIREAAAVMEERRIKRLPVVDEQGRHVGIISRADIVKAIGKKA